MTSTAGARTTANSKAATLPFSFPAQKRTSAAQSVQYNEKQPEKWDDDEDDDVDEEEDGEEVQQIVCLPFPASSTVPSLRLSLLRPFHH